ncbi:SDR family oxidoreductase [Mesorhizobium sp. M0854]|uniref:SDR family NAD(P)-dependent oxidoreductase n=1 Tax=Mesorhizobium sp. M0854 TaxID=2957013 RepID=UPI003334C89C
MAYVGATAGRLAGRRIVITGASSGIGRATAQLFIAKGAIPILLDLNGAGLAETIGDAEGLSFEVDITDENAVQDVVDQVAEKLGGLDGVVNAAGIMLLGPTADFGFDEWRKTIDVNLTGTFNVAKCCIPFLIKETGSTVVNVSSGAGLLPNAPAQVAYAAAKGGVISLTRALAADLAPEVRVNCVCPGLVDTPMAERFRANVVNYALKRMAEPSEIANAILFLTSKESSYITGSILAVDGGRTFH